MAKRRINLLFIVNSLGLGGAEKHVLTLLNSLDTARFRLSLAYLKDVDTMLPQLDRQRLQGGVFCCHVSGKIDLRAAAQLAAHIRENAVDIVVCTNMYSLLYGCLARRSSGTHPRLVEIFHSTELRTVMGKLQMAFYRPLFLICDMLVYVCESQRKYWRAGALRARRDMVINNGIDLDYFADRSTPESRKGIRKDYGFEAEDYVIGLCAALRPEKAHADLLLAVARLCLLRKNVRCLLIGEGPERPRIEALIDRLGLTQQVRITGFIEDVRPLVAACDVMTLVSHSETFSIAALEAMALGKPMVMSNIGGAAEQVRHGDNGYLYARGDIDALSSALLHLSEPALYRKMGLRARWAMDHQFALGAMVDAYSRLFSDMVQSALPPVRRRHVA